MKIYKEDMGLFLRLVEISGVVAVAVVNQNGERMEEGIILYIRPEGVQLSCMLSDEIAGKLGIKKQDDFVALIK